MNSITSNQEANEIKIKCSYNRQITAEMTKQDAAKKTKGWEVAEINWNKDELTKLVRTTAYSNSKLKDGYKVRENVEAVYFIVLDIDKGMDKDEFIKEAQKWQFSWFLHTTRSHAKAYVDESGSPITGPDKYRVWIPLSRPISGSELREKVKEYFISRCPFIDSSSFQGERYYHIAPTAETYIHNFKKENKIIFLNPEEIPSEKTISKVISPKENKSRNRKRKGGLGEFKITQEITLSDGSIKKIRDIEEKTPIYCPYCIHDSDHRSNPESPNAFVGLNDAGQYYIYCSSEGGTYWQDARDLRSNKSKLFFNTSTGGPTAINCEAATGIIPIYVFKNNDDFINYCMQKNISPDVKDYLPRREIIFDPKLPTGLSDNYCNVFEQSIYMKKEYDHFSRIKLNDAVSKLKNTAPTIAEIMINIFGEEDYLTRFLNWNSYILQTKSKAHTAWLISSEEQGVGKDFMFNFILKPIFGERQSQLLHGSRIGRQFNSQDMHCFLRGYNEVFSSNTEKINLSRKEWLKERITGQTQTIEFKGVDAFEAGNFMNFILFSNNDQPIVLDQRDRRFNVIRNPKSKKVINLSCYYGREELLNQVNEELGKFAELLFTLEYDIELANQTVDTRAKQDLISLSTDQYESFANALKTGDPEFFLLDEIFPPNSSERMFGVSQQGLVRSAIAEDLELKIEHHKLIPAKFMNAIIKQLFARQNYKDALKRLKAKNIICKQCRLDNLVQKVYIYEEGMEV